jgi:hypothetical protein
MACSVGDCILGIFVSYIYSWYFTPIPPYVNALRSDAAKWKIVHDARIMIKNNPQTQSCRVLIFRLQEPYSEELAIDLKSILDTIGWTYEEHFASSTVAKEITIRATNLQSSGMASGDGFRCADTFASSISEGLIKTRNGKFAGNPQQYYRDDTPENLKQCGPQCFEIDIGNEAAAD